VKSLIASVLIAFAFATPALAQSPLPPKVSLDLLNQAVTAPPPRWKFTDRRHPSDLSHVFALQFTAVAAHESPGFVVNGQSLAKHFAEKLRSFLVTPEPDAEGSTREPDVFGGIGGWTHNAAAQALLLARRTPEVWALLSGDERQRSDLLMQALAIGGHYSLDDENDYYVLLDGRTHYHRSWNPNHVAGYVGVMTAASLYFGAEPLNAFFESFDFDTFVARLDSANFQNIRRCWTRVPSTRTLLMNGGSIALGQDAVLAQGVVTSGAGVRNRFTYDGIGLDQPWALHRMEAIRLYSKAARTRVIIQGENTSYLLGRVSATTVSPWEGQMGMCHEFETTDWDGLRTSAIYAYEGVMIDLCTASTLKVLGEWRANEGGDTIERRMGVGMADLLFKVREGYRGWSQGKEHFTWWEKDLVPKGAPYIFNLWESYFAPPPAPTNAGDKSSAE
jgi:hypothetical protein